MSRSEIREFVAGIASLAYVFGPPKTAGDEPLPAAEAFRADLLAITGDARLVSVELAETIRNGTAEKARA